MSVGLLDSDPTHPLSQILAEAHVVAKTYQRLDELAEALVIAEHNIGVLAVEALGLDATGALARLERASARIILLVEPGGTRARFAHRMWAVGYCDAVVDRNDRSKLAETVRRFELEAALERYHRGRFTDATSPELGASRAIIAAMTGLDEIDTILLDFSRGLRTLVDYEAAGVLVLGASQAHFHMFQAQPVSHEVPFALAEKACAAIQILDPTISLTPDFLGYIQPTLLPRAVEAPREIDLASCSVLPLVAGSDLVGCLVVATAVGASWKPSSGQWIELIASYLAITLSHARLFDRARRLSDIDPLTGTNNRRFLDRMIGAEWSRAQRYSLQLSAIVVDIDNFSEVNLRGRNVGDSVLRHLADLLREVVRTADYVVRLGGDQFLILVPETGVSGSVRLIERIRLHLKTRPIEVEDAKLEISISCGVASHPATKVDTPQQLVLLAEEALASAKRVGQNQTEHAGSISGGTSKAESEHRREPRIDLDLPVVFLPISDVDPSAAIRLSSVNISAHGLAVRDRTRLLKRNAHGLAFIEDRPQPFLCKVAWSRSVDGEYHAGLTTIQSSDIQDSWSARRWDSRRALIITEDREYAAVAKRVLKATKHSVHAVTPEELAANAVDVEMIEGSSIIVIGERLLGTEVGLRVLEVKKTSRADSRIIVLNEDLDRERTVDMISSRQVEHLISSRAHPAESLFATLTKLLRRDFFGVHRYLLAGADTKTWSIEKPSEKSLVLAGVRAVASEVDCHPRIADLFISAVDEMLISALYAPKRRGGAEFPVTVECGADGRLLCVGVLDDYGFLSVEDIYAGLAAATRAQHERSVESADSAHLGFRIMLSSLSQLAVNVDPGRRTEIIGIIDLRKSLRDHRASAPGVGIFKP